MSRRQWTGIAGLLFGATMLIGIFVSGTTPDSTGSGAIDRYTEFWAEGDNQDRAAWGSMILTYSIPLLVGFAAGLSRLLRRTDDGPLPSVVLAAGTAAAALLGVGGALMNGAGLAGAESGYQADGNEALLLESVGYYALTAAMMCAGAMALATGLSNRTVRMLPAWTVVLAALLGLVVLGSIFTAWIGFMLLPIWAIVVGVCLLATPDREAAAEHREAVPAPV